MKIKEVEISAFRIFDNPKDATFNFSTRSGEIADFVSLYAPNGFGKTSFYDAIEWGITNNIQRFWQNKNLTNKSIDALGSQSEKPSQIRLLRNTRSSRETYVKITTDEKIVSPRKLEENKKKKTDIANSDVFENKDFRQVILSQEWISAFLKEEDGERRYQKFMENPELKDIDSYFINVKTIVKVCDETINDLTEKIEKKKLEIKDVGDKSLLEVINNQIKLLKEDFKEGRLAFLDINTTKEEIKSLKDIISERVIETNRVSILNEELEAIKTAKIGDEDIIGINLFFELIKQLNDINSKIEDIKNNLKKFEDYEKNENELSNNKKREDELRNKKTEIETVIKQFADYLKIQRDIENKINKKKGLEEEITSITKQASEGISLQILYKTQIDSLTQKIDENKNKLSEIPVLKENIATLKSELKSLENSDLAVKENYNKLEIEIKKDFDRISKIEKLINEIKLEEYHFLLEDDNNEEIINLIKSLEQKSKDKWDTILTNKKINEKIIQQQELNSTIHEFIKSGLAIVNERQTSVCPLCENDYHSYTTLADRISNNKALSSVLQELMQESNSNSQKLSALEAEIKGGNDELIKHYNAKLDILISVKKEKENQLVSLSQIKNDNSIKIEELKSKLTQISVQTEGLSIDEYEKEMDKRVKGLIKENTEILNLNTDLTATISNANQMLQVNNELAVNIEKEIKDLEKHEKYLLITEWFRINYPDDKIEKEILLNSVENLQAQIDELTKNINTTKAKLKSLKGALISFNKDQLLAQQKEIDLKITELVSKIEKYKNFIKENFNIDISQMTQESLSDILNIKEAELKSELKKISQLYNEYQLLEKYSGNIYEFLQSEKSKQDLEIMQNEHDFLNNKVKPLVEKERNKTREFLEQKVKGFFYESLINDLYKKIDPHPDFKSVEFRPDFNVENPTLNVFVRNSNGDELLIPNLYFSTAQINVLSLSIFLASALHSTDYDCIFIDDPIQSMDSINMLSTIDLLRSIVVNQKKQIILSTHDENFHNLLKKKMPPNLFKSKFMEFETFGKLKTDENTYEKSNTN